MVVTKNKFEFHVPESAVQSFDPHRQSTPAGLDVEPSVIVHSTRGLVEQSFEDEMQYNPVFVVQSAKPQRQSMDVAATTEPSVSAQLLIGRSEQLFETASQYFPNEFLSIAIA